MKDIAIVHDWVVDLGGAENCLASFNNIFPQADYFTLINKPESLEKLNIDPSRVRHSFLQKLPFATRAYRNFLPLFPLAIEQFDLSEYKVVLSSSHSAAKGVLTHAQQVHFCYCHSPMRYAWDFYHRYLSDAGLRKGLRGLLAKMILHYLRLWDFSTMNRADYFIANSDYIASRIKKVYNRDSVVIYPPVDVDKFSVSSDKEDFYLTASRFVPYKKIDLIVEAFSKMPDKKLVVIGNGPDFKKVKKLAGENVTLLGYQPFDVLHDHMQRASAFVFAAEEDFGIIPVEAQACGTPVIAYGKGGAAETIIEGKTGMFFYEQSVAAIIDALELFSKKKNHFKPAAMRKNAERFSRQKFEKNIVAYIQETVKNDRVKERRPAKGRTP